MIGGQIVFFPVIWWAEEKTRPESHKAGCKQPYDGHGEFEDIAAAGVFADFLKRVHYAFRAQNPREEKHARREEKHPGVIFTEKFEYCR